MTSVMLLQWLPSVFARLEFKPGGEAILWGIMLGGLALGIVCLCILDYLRDRVNRFLPILPDEITSAPKFMVGSISALALLALLSGGGLCSGAIFGFTFAGCVYIECSDAAQRRREIAHICSEIAEALHRRLPLDEFLYVLSNERTGTYCDALKQIAMKVHDGMRLSVALERTGLFAPEMIASIHESELSGGRTLADVLRVAADEQNFLEQNRTKIRTALLYPLFVWAAVLPLAAFVAEFALPRLYFVGARYRPVPSEFYSAIGPAVLVSLGLIAIGANLHDIIRQHRTIRSIVLWLLSRAPFLGRQMRHRYLARAIRTLGSMINSGVPFGFACRRVANPDLAGPYSAGFRRLGVSMERGDAFDAALKGCGLPESFVCLAQAGARGGTLTEALSAAADWHSSRADRLDRIVIAAVPCIAIPLAGIMVGVVYGSVFWQITSIHEYQLHQLRIMQ